MRGGSRFGVCGGQARKATRCWGGCCGACGPDEQAGGDLS